MRKPVFFLAAISMLGVLTFVYGRTFGTLAWTKFTNPSPHAATQAPSDPIRNIRFTVYDVAIYPHEVQVEAGRIAIAFDDRTGRNGGFMVQRITERGQEDIGEITFPRDRWRTRQQVRLGPGRYRVSSRERPEIQSILIVTP